MDGKPVVIPGKNNAHLSKDYPEELTKWVTDILIRQQAGPSDHYKNTFTSFSTKIFDLVHAKIVFDHIAVSPTLHTIMLTRLIKQLQLIILWPKIYPPLHLEKTIKNGEHHNIW